MNGVTQFDIKYWFFLDISETVCKLLFFLKTLRKEIFQENNVSVHISYIIALIQGLRYNKNTKLAEQQRKSVDEHFMTKGVYYCSIDATAHYSYV